MTTTQTQREPDIMDLEMLTPGSVWVRRDGKASRYLFTTNTSLPVGMAARFPQMAIYADENDNLFSVPVADFIGKRTFFNVDPGLESRCGDLLALNVDNTEDELDLLGGPEETLLLDETDASQEDFDAGDDTSETPGTPDFLDTEYPSAVQYFAEGTGLPEVISPERLSELTASYQQLPLLNSDQLQHTLYIRAASDISRDMLYACFSPKHVELNAVYSFKVNTTDGVLDVDWDALVGIFPFINDGEQMHQVIFTSSAQILYTRVDEDSADTEVDAAAEVDAPNLWEENRLEVEAAAAAVEFAATPDADGQVVIAAVARGETSVMVHLDEAGFFSDTPAPTPAVVATQVAVVAPVTVTPSVVTPA